MNKKGSLYVRYPDLFEDEASDPALEQLVDDLETTFASARRPANLEQRLQSTIETVVQKHELDDQPPISFPERRISPSSERLERGWRRQLSTLAAAILIAFIASLLILVLNQAHQPGQAHQGSPDGASRLNRFLSIHMINESTGWAQVSNESIRALAVVYTVDGGSHWQNVTPSQLSASRDDNPAMLYAVNAKVAWITTTFTQDGSHSHSVIFRTTDAGRSWQNIPLPSFTSGNFSINRAHFLDDQLGWIAVTAKPGKGDTFPPNSLWWTSNGGQTWSLIKLPASITNADSITFIDAQSWLLTGIQNNHEAPFVFTTNDAGTTWHQHKLPVPNSNKAFQTWQEGTGQFFSANEGLLTVRYLIKNGSPLANANAFSPTDSALAVYVTHDGGTSWSLLSSLQLAGEPQQGKYYSYGWPVFTDTQHGWIYQSSVTITGKEVPASNRLLITADGGKHWEPILVKMPGGRAGQTVTPDNAWSSENNPYFISAKIGWLIGYYSPIKSDLLQNKLFKTVDGGQTWETVQYSIT